MGTVSQAGPGNIDDGCWMELSWLEGPRVILKPADPATSKLAEAECHNLVLSIILTLRPSLSAIQYDGRVELRSYYG